MNFPTKIFQKQKLPILFIDKTSKPSILSENKINVILSPSFYWVKKESLPVKSAYKAKKFLPSLFESILPEGNYSYHAIKKDDGFEVFAYDDAAIISYFEQNGIKTSQIEGVYFAQIQIPPQEEPFLINDQVSMVCNDGIWSIIPSKYVKNANEISKVLQNVTLKEKISIDLFKNFVLPQEQLNKIIASFVVLILIFAAEHFILQKEFKNQIMNQFKILDDYSLPKTSIELQSQKNSLLEEESSQEALRLAVKKLLNLPLLDGEKFIKIEGKKGSKISFSIILKEPKRGEILKEAIPKELKILSLKVVDSTLRGEVGL